ncbi:hypothetical protein LTS17_008914 [Exophiala oligosperma]
MGGLVVADALHRAKDALDKYEEDVYHLTYAIAFLGTPHLGASLASWASVGAKFLYPLKRTNIPLVEVLEKRSEELRDIQRRFHLMLSKRATAFSQRSSDSPYPINLYCFFESEALKIVGKVVEEESAVLNGWGSASIHANHMGMTRFPHENDDGFRRRTNSSPDFHYAWGYAELRTGGFQDPRRRGADLSVGSDTSSHCPVTTPTASAAAAVPAVPSAAPTTQQAAEAPSETPDPGQEQPSELPDRPAQQGRGERPKQQPAYFPIGQPAREEKYPKKSKKNKSTGPTFNFNKPRGGQWQVAGGDINNRGRAFGGKASNVEDDSEEDDSSEESAGDD